MICGLQFERVFVVLKDSKTRTFRSEISVAPTLLSTQLTTCGLGLPKFMLANHDMVSTCSKARGHSSSGFEKKHGRSHTLTYSKILSYFTLNLIIRWTQGELVIPRECHDRDQHQCDVKN